jgi:alpha-1,3-rhamnosyl/mannosyltransferase
MTAEISIDIGAFTITENSIGHYTIANMKIIIDARLILPQQTGIGRYLLNLIQALANLSGSEEFECWVQGNLPDDHPIWTVKSSRIKIKKISVAHMSIRQQWAIPLMVKRTSHDIFHYPHFDLPFATPGKTVVTLYDLKYILHPDFFPQLAMVKRLMMKIMMANAARRAQRVITISNNSLHDIIRQFHTPSDKIRVTHLGVDNRFFLKSDPNFIDTFRKRYSLQDPFILFVGERRPHKNISGVIQAFNKFISMSPKSYRLVIAGKPYRDFHEPEHLVKNLGLMNRVIFFDSPPDSDVHLLFQSAEALMLLSRYEGFGLPILEAMASGTPVIASNTTSLPEIVDDAGVVVPVDEPDAAAEALNSVVIGGENRDKFIKRGFEHARQFTWERCAQQTIDVYRELQ